MKKITIKFNVRDKDYNMYEKFLDDFLNNLDEFIIAHNVEVYEKDSR